MTHSTTINTDALRQRKVNHKTRETIRVGMQTFDIYLEDSSLCEIVQQASAGDPVRLVLRPTAAEQLAENLLEALSKHAEYIEEMTAKLNATVPAAKEKT